MNASALRTVGSSEGNSQPPMDSILKRLEILENGLASSLATLKGANDRLWGRAPEGQGPIGATNASPAPQPRSPLLDEISDSLDRLVSLSQRLNGEAGRADNLSTR